MKTIKKRGISKCKALAVWFCAAFVLSLVSFLGFSISSEELSRDGVLSEQWIPPEVEWSKTIGGTANDNAFSIQQTFDGGFIIVGFVGISGTANINFYLRKSDGYGNWIWSKMISGNPLAVGYSVRQTSDGGYIATGYRWSSSGVCKSFFLIKTDGDGNELWSTTFGDDLTDAVGYSVRQTSDGGYIICGDITYQNPHNQDVLLIKTDSYGNEMWSNIFGNTEYDSGCCVQETFDGGYIIAGNVNPGNTMALFKVDSDGNEEWSKTYDAFVSGIDDIVQQTSDGGYITVGFKSVEGDYRQIYLLKTDSQGNEEWQKTYGENSFETGNSVRITSDGGYIITGTFAELAYGHGDNDFYLIKTDSAGNVEWSKTVDNRDLDYGQCGIETSDGGYAVVGSTKFYSSSDQDIYLLKLSPPIKNTITLIAPNGSEVWVGETSHSITWSSTGSISNVKIEYSTDNGSSWNTIAASTANSGSYGWTVPNTPSANCLVKVSDTAGPATDTSDAVFTIAAQRTVTVTAPNGGENWEGSTNHNITWSSTGSISNVKIEYSTDNGSSWNTIAASTANSGSYGWTVPNTPSSNCLVKVSDTAGPATDTSDAVFTIAAQRTVTVTAPNGGENWEGSTNHNITWSSTGSISNVKIDYSTDNGSSWNTIAASTANSGSYGWTVPNTPSSNCLVKVSDTAGPATDTSDAVFTIAAQRTVTVTAPNGGENWEGSTNHNITWFSTGSISNVKIEYSTDNGSSWNTIAASTANSGSYGWIVPNTPSANCLVKVSDTAGPATDTSDVVFTIAAQRTVTVTAPNGGERWFINSIYPVTWSTTGSIANVRLEYSINGGSSWNTIVSSISNSGNYDWTIPNTPSTNCLVKVIDTSGPASDVSDSVFTIDPYPTITVTAPNGGENWDAGIAQTRTVTWTNTGTIANVNIEYSDDGGSSWNLIVTSAPNTGNYNWVLPAVDSSDCLVRISDTVTSASDMSNGVFTIWQLPSITVTAPNGGEVWPRRSTQTITWTSTGNVGNVEIQYSKDGGSNWTLIVSSTTNDGNFQWTLPNVNKTKTQCLVKITDVNGSAEDTSDSVFSIQK